jgi:Tfp pilus assembly protein FimT
MSTGTETQPRRERTVIYVVTVALLVILGVIAVIMFLTAREGAQAQDKAEQFIASLEAEGVDVNLTPEQVARVLGDDGGVVCADPGSALTRALLLDRLSNGAGGPGQRPIIAEDRLVQGELLIIETYCPDELEDFQQFIDDLNTVDGDGS